MYLFTTIIQNKSALLLLLCWQLFAIKFTDSVKNCNVYFDQKCYFYVGLYRTILYGLSRDTVAKCYVEYNFT